MATVIRGDDNFDTSIGANVVQTHVTIASTQALAGNTVDVTGLTATITPKHSTSKIMVEVRWCGESGTSDHDLFMGMRRGGVDIGNPDAAGSRLVVMAAVPQGYHADDRNSTPTTTSYSYLDSPLTTSPVTYTATMCTVSTVTLYNNRTGHDTDGNGYERLTSSITLTEVQG